MDMVHGDLIQNICICSGSPETYRTKFDYSGGNFYPFYIYDDALVSPDEGDEEPENETGDNSNDGGDKVEDPEEVPEEEPEETVSENEADPEEEQEDPVSENEADPEVTVSDNTVSDNSASDNHIPHYVDYTDSLSGNIIVVNNDGLHEYMPTVIEILSIIGGLLLAFVVFELCKYIYKFFRVFF